ncbi:MAG: hypothetical protein V3S06_04805, partial [candidate division Zixibacteria bacterium]
MRILFKKKNSSIIKSTESKGEAIIDESLRGQKLIFRVALSAVLVFGITFLYPIDKVYLPIEVPQTGEIATEDIAAPFDFPIYKTEDELKRDRDLVISNLRPVVIYDKVLGEAVRDGIRNFFENVDSIAAVKPDSLLFLQSLRYEFPSLSESLLIVLRDPSAADSLKDICISAIDSLVSLGVVPKLENLPFEESGLVTTRKEDKTKTVARDLIFDMDRALGFLSIRAELAFANNPEMRRAATGIMGRFL